MLQDKFMAVGIFNVLMTFIFYSDDTPSSKWLGKLPLYITHEGPSEASYGGLGGWRSRKKAKVRLMLF
jgi:hypothetical protein